MLFVPLVMTLAIGAGSLPALLSTRVMVFGGQISFCLYMVHELVHTSWIWTAEQFQLTLQGDGGKLIVAGLLAITFVTATVLYYLVEEPARRWMRRMVDVGRPKADAATEPAAHAAGGKLQSIDGSHEGATEAAVGARGLNQPGDANDAAPHTDQVRFLWRETSGVPCPSTKWGLRRR